MAEITNEQRKKIIKVEQLETFAELVDIIKADKDVNSIEGHIAVFNNDGNPVDSNYSFQNIPILDANGKVPASQLNIVEGYLDSGVFYKVENTAADYVEIGGLKWATKNIGASNVTDYGLHFQWGDTQGYTTAQVGSGSGQKYFGWADYKYGNGTSSPGATGMTKYNSTDDKTVLDLADDAARANWGGNWRMPTTDEYAALGAAVNSAWTADYEGSGVKGLVLTSKADSSKVLFFPAAGLCSNGSVSNVGSDGFYWSSSVGSSNVQNAYFLYFNSSRVNWQLILNRFVGCAIRGVWDGQGTPIISQTVQVTPESNTLYIDTTTNKIYRYNGSSYVEVSSAPSYTLDEVNDGSVRKLSNYPKKTIEITWANLKAARDNSQLVPGQWYRITDYHTTTVQSETQSADHQFDVIVRADTTDILNENAFAALHSGDTYFSASTLSAWELKYSLDNDTNRFQWADSTNGKGVIWYMKDEFSNECPYDFKNIMFARWKATAITTSSTAVTEGFVQSMKDIFVGHYHSYTSSNISLSNKASVIVDSNDSKYFYTFSLCTNDWETFESSDNDYVVDGSLKGYGDNMYTSNVIKEYIPFDKDYSYKLNNIVFKPISDEADDCGNNVFGKGCHDITLGFSWTVNNSFGNGCGSNSFGNGCYNNSFGNSCNYNSFGNSCYDNSFGNYFQYNSFGNYFQCTSFGNSCNFNSFGNGCYNNSFGNSCNFNSFGNECYRNSFGNSCNYNSFGNGCQYINFQKDYMRYNIVENGNQYINVTSTQTTSSSNVLRNITIAQGVNNTSTVKTISHNTVNDTFKTTYQPQNSQVVSV